MTVHPIAVIILLAICALVPSGRAEDPTPPITPPPAANIRKRIPAQPVATPEPEKPRKPFNVTLNELNGFNYDLESRAFYFNYNGESYWFSIARIDPESKPETGLLLLQQILASKVLRVEALTNLVSGYVVVKNISLYY